jgi:glycosyltransferase involved in cell wall biosynthesis
MVYSLGSGGTERQLTEVARSLDRTRYQVHVACFHKGMRADELETAGIPIVHLPVRSFLRPSALRGAWLLIRYLHKHRIRMVHTFDYPLNCFGVLVAVVARTPAILSSQRAHRELTPPLYWKILRITDRLVKGIVVNSDSVRRDMVERERVPATLLHLCYNGIDTTRFQPGGRKRMAALAEAKLVVGVVCVLRPEKGLSTLIKAFASLINAFAGVQEHYSGTQLAIVGSGPELAQLQALTSELGIRDHVWFEPATANVPGWLGSIDIFVLPSLSEALSNSLMEAMACGCACIASRTGGNPELIVENETGLLFEPGNADDLAEKLEQLARDRGLRGRFAQAAVERIRSQFSLSASVTRMQEIYETVLAKR